jgi:leucine dehydrogenase
MPVEIREIPVDGFERVARAEDPESGLLAFIAVHSTVLGPAGGGLRIWWYDSEDAALTDVLRLAEGMSYKSAVARTGLGGGKSVMICRREDKTPEKLRAMGRFVDAFQGAYRIAEDVGCTVEDLTIVREETPWVTGLAHDVGGSGNPSPYTAHGCWLALKATAERALGSDSLEGRRIAVLGTGAVGAGLVRRCVEEGASIVAFDIDTARLEGLRAELGIEIAASEQELMTSECDILSPCALGGLLNDQTIPELRCKAIAGAANNQLLEPRHGEMLQKRGILYAPDYVVNAGGIVNIGVEFIPGGYDEKVAYERIGNIPAALREVFDVAEQEGVATSVAAQRIADRRIEEGRQVAG